MGQRGINAKPVKRRAGSSVKPPRRREPWRKRGLTRAERVIVFIEGLKITSGIFAGKPFKLRPWQRAFIEAIYRTNEKGRRVVRVALLTLPRKNGKTQLAAALALCHLVGPEAEPRGQVYSAAADRPQATLILKEMVAMIRADRVLNDRIIIREHNKTLEDVDTGSVYTALSSDARKAHGLNVSFAVMDELAQWKSRDLYEALTTGGAARAEPLFVVISTQSHDANHVMTEITKYGRNVLDGTIDDPTFFAAIYAADDEADPWDEATWFACNPALGDFRSLDEMRASAAQAQALPAREPAFRLLYLNQPTDPSARFLNARDWKACYSEPSPLFGLGGRRCILALDLSSTTDLSACVAFFPETGDLLPWFWMPADGMEEAERRDRAPYALWARQGLITATPGRAIDKRFIAHRLGQIVADFKIEFAVADRWRLDELERLLVEAGVKLKLEPFGQGWKMMGPAIDAFETAVLRREIKHPGHAVLDWNVAEAVCISDPTGARKLVKNRAAGRIDGLVAAVMAVGASANAAAKRPSVYSTRGLISVKVA
jgi:phage terminase large subunit-like protein